MNQVIKSTHLLPQHLHLLALVLSDQFILLADFPLAQLLPGQTLGQRVQLAMQCLCALALKFIQAFQQVFVQLLKFDIHVLLEGGEVGVLFLQLEGEVCVHLGHFLLGLSCDVLLDGVLEVLQTLG